MTLGRKSLCATRKWLFLFIFLGLSSVSSLSAKDSSEKDKKTEPKPESLFEAAADREWAKVISLSEAITKPSPLIQILRQKAFFEQEEWSKLLEAVPITDSLFADYDQYLRILTAYEKKKYELVLKTKMPEGLPRSLQESIDLIFARTHAAQNNQIEAKQAYRKFLDKYPYSRYKSDVLLELANLEWKLENRLEALSLYEKIYTFHPLQDAQNVAKERLEEGGRFETISPDAHLQRVNKFQRAALFAKAIKEVQSLKTKMTGRDLNALRLAIARLEFARKDYPTAERMARAELKDKDSDRDAKLEAEWLSLHAFSLTRLGRFDEATQIYQQLLSNKELSDYSKEVILLRLGLMAIDDENFKESQGFFEKLRKDFSNGNYRESAHWFEAWSIYQFQRLQPKPDTKRLDYAAELLSKLPNLPQGSGLEAQAIYWKEKVFELAGNQKKANTIRQKFNREQKASFHFLLEQKDAFEFLNFDKNFTSSEIIQQLPKSYLVPDPAFQQRNWKRVEAFSKANLSTWAQLELSQFLVSTGKKNSGLRHAVANRLIQLNDWSDLIRYAQTQFPISLKNLDPKNKETFFHYPQSYHKQVLAAANEFEVSPFLVWGVMREESRFQADVISSAGAVGLLQLMPQLGKRIARNLKEKPISRVDLTDADLNVRYGTFHLKELINQVKGWDVPPEFVMPLVVASYNAGSSPVRRWVNEIGTDRLDVFVESIPYSETRAYVKRVLQSAQIYYLLYAEKVKRMATKEGETKL